jgi:hypothetical protein
MDTFYTREAMRLPADSSTLENYYSPDQAEQVYCTTREREDFEQENEIALTQDVIEDQRDYDTLVRYLAEDCGLQRVPLH